MRVLLLKLADREHNILTLKYLENQKQVRVAFETQAIFNPLKRILGYREKLKIKDVEKKYKDFLAKNKLLSPKDSKEFLYKMSFRDLNQKMFDLVYNNSEKVVWEIEDKQYLEELSKNKDFEKHINIECMWTDGKIFKASFTFDKGYIIRSNVELKISSYKQN